MALLDDVGTLLAAQVGSLTLGTNLFLGRLPDEPDTAVALFETGGEAPVNTMGGGLYEVEQPRLQVLTRGASYSATHALAMSVWLVLEATTNDTLSATLYHRITAVQSPFPIERDSKDRIVFSQNFRVQRER